MKTIVLLDDLTINQIAAGEVIERPANVVKELVENAIDANATNVTIEIKNGGKTFVKITDNGKGIPFDDMEMAFERHATSKIRKVEDLEKIYSMGFRGEALASMASIAKVTMLSKTKDEEVGYKVVNKAGTIIEKEEVAIPNGTTIIVEDLFFNTPVRYKFLKQDSTEFKYIKDLVQRMALANNNVSLTLKNGNETIFRSSGNGSLEDIIYTLYGKEIRENIIKVNYDRDNIKITGVVGNTNIAKENRKDQIFFLNKRYIQNKVLASSSDQAFKGATGIGKYGFFILNIEMSPDNYDINVHPTKMEVRFKDESKIYKAMYHAIKEALLQKDFLGNSENENEEKYVDNEYNFLTSHFVKDYNSVSTPLNKVQENTNFKETSNNETLRYKIIGESEQGSNRNDNQTIQRENKRRIEYKFIGILLRTYIIVEIENELYLIDQHAAHERILYEQIKANYKNHIKNNIQMMLIPEVVNLPHNEMEFVRTYMQMFQDIGFDIEEFGDNSIKINGIPDIDYKTNSKHIFLDILDEMLTNERGGIRDVEERFIATVACKAAVKAHMDLGKDEVDYLIQNLLILNNPYTCPHGRPTTIKYTKEELEKMLG